MFLIIFFCRFVLCTPVNRNQLQLLAAACILLRLVAFSFGFDYTVRPITYAEYEDDCRSFILKR